MVSLPVSGPDPLPLFGGIPGGPELIVLLLVLLMFLLVPLALVALGVVGGVKLLDRDDGSGEVERLRERVDELESRLAKERDDDGRERDQ